MKKTIWKFELDVQDNIEINLPKGAEILSVQAQYGTPCIWALVNPEESLETRKFKIFGTGHPILVPLNKKDNFIGTFQLSQGALVFHLFEVL